MLYRLSFLAISLIALFTASRVVAQQLERSVTVAALDFGNSRIGRLAAETLSASLKTSSEQSIVDRDQARAAARGVEYAGSLNMSRQEARRLGEAIGCDFYLIGDAQTIRRSSSTRPIYFESYASIFLVSSRTGRLVIWQRPSFLAATEEASEERLFSELSNSDTRRRILLAIRRAREDERMGRELALDSMILGTPVIQEAPDNNRAAEKEGLRLPRPYRRLRPAYPDSAARAEAEATVDVLVDLDANGEVDHVEVARWAGFGLDEATVETVRRLHFFPALRNGAPIPIRVLLRYNFRKPSK